MLMLNSLTIFYYNCSKLTCLLLNFKVLLIRFLIPSLLKVILMKQLVNNFQIMYIIVIT